MVQIGTRVFVEVRFLLLELTHKTYGTVTKGVSKGMFKSSSLFGCSLSFFLFPADTVGDLKKYICKRWGINESEVEVWNGQAKSLVTDMQTLIGELGILSGQKVFMDDKRMIIGGELDDDSQSSNGNYASSSNSHSVIQSSYTSQYSQHSSLYPSSYSYNYNYSPKTYSAGLCGLNNLG